MMAARQAPLAATRKGIVARLLAAGVPSALAAAAAERITPADCRGGSAEAVRRALSAECASFIVRDSKAPRIEVFVGPPGVGKTTTIAKIVAQERAQGRDPRGMIAADAFRVGAIEHLRGYASVIGAPFRVARDASELEAALAASVGFVIVDTAGRSPADEGFRSLLDVLRRRTDVRTHLVVAADTSIEAANRLFDRYASARPDRVVITKLDEAHSAAPLLGVIRARQLPISFLTAGQRVPQDLEAATEQAIASALLGEMAEEGVACH
jgi:flagellar biosynthesis protein FlhF